MKTNIINSNVKSKNVKLPALYESINKPLIILLVTGKDAFCLEGTALISKDENTEIGEYSVAWDENSFMPMISGSKIELIQE